MSWFIASLAAQFALGSSAVFDKLILKKSYHNPVGYTFWLGIMGLSSLALIPFGFTPTTAPILLGLFTGVVFVLALLFFYFALFGGEASNTIPLIGALSSIITLVWSYLLLHLGLNLLELLSFALLIIGGIFLTATEPKNVRRKVVLFAILSSLLLGLSNVLTKATFLETNFVTGFVWIKIGAALTVFSFLIIPSVRKSILHPYGQDEFRNRWGYVGNRSLAGLGSVLLYFAFSLGSPALVSATTNLQYVFIFLGGWLLLKERFRGWIFAAKITALVFISLGIIALGMLDYLKTNAPAPNRPISWGVTFSQKFSTMMGFDWKENYDAILTDLKAKHLRLVAYWDLIEPRKGQFDFTDLDYQMNRARDAGASIILTIGRKVPRWPECHEPSWTNDLLQATKNQQLLDYMKVVIERYKDSPALLYWQVENEPFLPFGICPPLDTNLLDREIALVRSTDPAHPVLLTDSGELSLWYHAAEKSDAFGTTMYRRVENKYFGNIDYHLPPEFFRIKEWFSRFITGNTAQPYLVIELGAEPWLHHQLYETDIRDQLGVFDLPFFEDTIVYAKSAGFDDYYLWGAEWWYWMKVKHGDSSFWDYAKSVMQSTP
jgi:drug/metabolite transporter (DMT)-like permease